MSTATEVLENAIAKRRSENQRYINSIESQGNLLNDFVTGLGKNKGMSFDSQGDRVLINMSNGHDTRYTMHVNAIYQAAEKLGIGAKYLKDLSEGSKEWQAKLAAHILNEHSTNTERQRVLIREVGGEVRGILSDQYRRLNTGEIYASFLQASRNVGLEVYSAYANDLRSWIECISPQIMTIPLANSQFTEVAFGARISSSDFGTAALDMRLFMIQVVCLNGMTRDTVMREIHLGSKLPDNLQLSDRTYRLDTLKQASLAKDAISSLMNKESIVQQAMTIQKAVTKEVDYESEFKKLNKIGLLKSEIEEAEKLLIGGKKEDGLHFEGSNLWKFAQSISAVGRTKDEQRKRELEEMSGLLLKQVEVKRKDVEMALAV